MIAAKKEAAARETSVSKMVSASVFKKPSSRLSKKFSAYVPKEPFSSATAPAYMPKPLQTPPLIVWCFPKCTTLFQQQPLRSKHSI